MEKVLMLLPAGEHTINTIEGWKDEVRTKRIWYVNPLEFKSFGSDWDYRGVFKIYRHETNQFYEDPNTLVVLRIHFKSEANLINARQFLLTLVEKRIPVAARFPNDEFRANLLDLVVGEI